MGKSSIKLVVGTLVRLQVALVEWLPEFNVSRANKLRTLPRGKESKSTGEVSNGGVFEDIRDNGWNSAEPAEFIELPYSFNSLATAENIIAARRKRVAEWSKDESTIAVANLMSDIWFPNGKPVMPIAIGNSGNGRGLSLPFILLDAVQRAAASGKEYNPAEFTVAGIVIAPASELQRVEMQSLENERRKMAGVADSSWADKLEVGQFLLRQKGGNENALRRSFGQVGTAQKVYRILSVANKFPDAHLLERINMPRPDAWKRTEENYVAGGYVPAASLDKERLKKVLDGEQTLEAYIVEMYKGGSGSKSKVMDRTVWEGLQGAGVQDGSPFALIRKCHLENLGFGEVFSRYPELAKATYVGSIGEGATAKGATAKGATAKGATAKGK